LVAGARIENTGTQWNMIRTVAEKNGVAPSKIEVVHGRITLRGSRNAEAVTITPLDGASRPLGASYPATRAGDDWQFRIGQRATTWYEIVVSR